MRQQHKISILLLTGIVVIVFLLSRQYFVRIDLTEDRQYTMSKATKNLLRSLEDPVDIKAYFSENLPADIERVRNDFQNLLIEYNNISKGKVNYRFINPGADQATEQEAMQAGIQPVLINVREKDEASQKKAFMGAIVSYGDQKEILPFIGQQTAMEYSLTTAIKKITVTNKPVLGIIQGHGEPQPGQMAQVYQALSVLYQIESLDLKTVSTIPDRMQALLLINPRDSIAQDEFQKLDTYLSDGGKMIVAVNAVEGNLSNTSGSVATNNVPSWLSTHGLQIDSSFVIDASCGKVSVQQNQGFFNFTTQVNFPYMPLVTAFPEHPVTKGLEAVLFQFASPLRFHPQGDGFFTELVTSSPKSGVLAAPVYFDIQKRWTEADFPNANIALGGIVEGVMGNPESKLVVFSDGDFITSDKPNVNPDNVNLMVNTLEWLVDKSGLAELRTKGVVYRPIADLEDGKRTFTKYFNFILPLALVGAVGLWRAQRNRNKRIQRMQEKLG